jgi:hypothetical protein
MKFIKYISPILLLICFNCKESKRIKEFHYGTGEIEQRIIYARNNDTMNYDALSFYKNGRLQNSIHIKEGKPEGVFLAYYENGLQEKIRTFREGKLNGIMSVFNENGQIMRESFYINDKQVIYSEFYVLEDSTYEKQLFTIVKSGQAYPIGHLVKRDHIIQNDLSYYAEIKGMDTVNSTKYCFTLNVYIPNDSYEKDIVFGKFNENLSLEKSDTSLITKNSNIKLCLSNMKTGWNDIFGKVSFKNNLEITSNFYVYKQFYVQLN